MGDGGRDNDRLGHLKFQASCKHCSCCSCKIAGLTLDTLSVLTVARVLTAFWRASKSNDLQRSLSPEDRPCTNHPSHISHTAEAAPDSVVMHSIQHV